MLKALVRTVPDFPAKGISFRDINTLIAHPLGFNACVEHLAYMLDPVSSTRGFDTIAGVEARGFIFGAALANRIGTGFVPVRKAGKLPAQTIGIDYALEYGAARLELDPTLVERGERVVLVDDLIATGGTALAAVHLLRQAGTIVEHALFVIDLPDMGGARALRANSIEPHCIMAFDGS